MSTRIEVDITFVTTANTDEEAYDLLNSWACPLENKKGKRMAKKSKIENNKKKKAQLNIEIVVTYVVDQEVT